MFVGKLTDQQMERLKRARELKKYGALETWQELFIYQLSIGNYTQLKEIAEFAARKNKGEDITLPLKDFKGRRLAPLGEEAS